VQEEIEEVEPPIMPLFQEMKHVLIRFHDVAICPFINTAVKNRKIASSQTPAISKFASRNACAEATSKGQ